MQALLALIIILLAHTAAAQDVTLNPPSAMTAGLPATVVAESRAIADYSLVVQAKEWVAGPAFADGQVKWFLQTEILEVITDDFVKPGITSPFQAGGTLLVIPYCSQGAVSAPGGPGNGCAAFVGRKLRVWGLLADLRARKITHASESLLLQAENLLDAAFLP